MKLSALWGVYYVLIVPLTAQPWGTGTIILLLQRMSWGSERFTYLPKGTRQRSDSTMIHTLLPAQNPCFLSSSPLGLAAMLRSPDLGLWAERPGGWWVRAKVAQSSSGRLCPAMEHGSRSPVHEEAGVHVPQLCIGLHSSGWTGWLTSGSHALW